MIDLLTLPHTTLRRIGYLICVATAFAIAGCGSFENSGPASGNAAASGSYTLGGTSHGLTSAGLVLANDGVTLAIDAGASSFTFGSELSAGAAYSVRVAAQPAGLICSVANATGTMPAANVTNLAVSCSANIFMLGGTISGLTNLGLVLDNNGATLAVDFGADSFEFGSHLSAGTAYAVTVATQPTGLTCSVANGSGTMPAANVTNVAVTCTANIVPTYTLGGTISGLSSSGLVLANNGVTLAVSSGASSFTFGTALNAGTGYAVTVSTQPTGLTCSVANGSGTMPAANVPNVAVTCTANIVPTYTLGGTISGLSSSGLVLANNGVTLAVSSGASSFTFGTALNAGTAYAVTVSTQPAGLTCAVANGSGTMPAANTTSVTVTCTPNRYTLGGTVSGLTSSGLVLANGSATLAVVANATSFTLPSVAYGSSYAVTVATQPSGGSCSVTNASGTMPAANVMNVAVICSWLQQVYQCNDVGATGTVAVDTNSLSLTDTMPNCTNMVAVSLLGSTLALQRWHPADLADPYAIWQAASGLPVGWGMWTPNGWQTLSQVLSGMTAPTIPTGLVATPESDSIVQLTWAASTDNGGAGIGGYTIYRNGSAIGTAIGASTSYTDVGLTGGSQYGYDVAAFDVDSNASAQSAPSSATTLSASGSAQPVYQCDDAGAAGTTAVDTNSLGLTVTMPNCTSMVAVSLASATLTLQRWHPGDLADPYAIWQAPSSLPVGWSMWTPNGWQTLSQVFSGATAPTIPMGLVATPATSSTIQLTWTASTDGGGPGIGGYTIYRNGSPIGTTSSTSYTDVGLTGGTQYSYDLAAFDVDANASGQSVPASATTSSSGSGSMQQVYQCNDAGAAGRTAVDTNSLALTVTMPNCTNMVAVSLVGTSLTLQRWHPGDLTDPGALWQAASALPLGWSMWTPNGWETLSQVLSGTLPPTPPTGLVATPQSGTAIQLSWTASTDNAGPGIGGYTIYRNGSPVGTALGASTSFTDVGLTGGTPYNYDVSAFDVDSNASALSVPASATTP